MSPWKIRESGPLAVGLITVGLLHGTSFEDVSVVAKIQTLQCLGPATLCALKVM